MIGQNGNKKNRLRFPVSSVSSEEFDRKLRKVGAEIFPFSLFLGVKKQWCVIADCKGFLKEIEAEVKRKSINSGFSPKVRKRDNEYYYFNNDVVVITTTKR